MVSSVFSYEWCCSSLETSIANQFAKNVLLFNYMLLELSFELLSGLRHKGKISEVGVKVRVILESVRQAFSIVVA